jgi:hypothetical protein
MIELSAAGRAGTPDEVGTVGALLMGSGGAFITGSDILMDGGVTAAYWFGELAPKARATRALKARTVTAETRKRRAGTKKSYGALITQIAFTLPSLSFKTRPAM